MTDTIDTCPCCNDETLSLKIHSDDITYQPDQGFYLHLTREEAEDLVRRIGSLINE